MKNICFHCVLEGTSANVAARICRRQDVQKEKGKCKMFFLVHNCTSSPPVSASFSLPSFSPSCYLDPQRIPSGIPLPPELNPPTRPKKQQSAVVPPQGKKLRPSTLSSSHISTTGSFHCCDRCTRAASLKFEQTSFFF